MKIIYTIHQFFPDYYTGTEKYLLNMATMMQKLGHEVLIVTYNPSSISNLQSKNENIFIKKYIYKGLKVISIKDKDFESATLFDIKCKDIEDFFFKLFKKEQPNIFHVTHPMHVASSIIASKKLKIKTVITLTDDWMLCGKGIFLRNDNNLCLSPNNGVNCKKYCYQNFPLERLKNRVIESKEIFNKTDAQIVSAKFLIKLFEYNQYNMSKTFLIRHGQNYFDKYIPIVSSKRKKIFTFISAGSLTPHKGVHILIPAFRKLKNQDLRLKIYGASYGNIHYYNYLKKLAIGDKRISFEGTYTINETSKIHQNADVVVQPSLWYETYPLVGVAALAYGIPIIVPDTTGAAELVNPGENGYIFKFGDINSLSEQLDKAYKDKLKQNKIIFYPQTIESEAIATQEVYYNILNEK